MNIENVGGLAFAIMLILNARGAKEYSTSITVKEISDGMDGSYKQNTIYKCLMKMMAEQWIGKGIKEANASTYYITESGILVLDKIRNK